MGTHESNTRVVQASVHPPGAVGEEPCAAPKSGFPPGWNRGTSTFFLLLLLWVFFFFSPTALCWTPFSRSSGRRSVSSPTEAGPLSLSPSRPPPPFAHIQKILFRAESQNDLHPYLRRLTPHWTTNIIDNLNIYIYSYFSIWTLTQILTELLNIKLIYGIWDQPGVEKKALLIIIRQICQIYYIDLNYKTPQEHDSITPKINTNITKN